MRCYFLAGVFTKRRLPASSAAVQRAQQKDAHRQHRLDTRKQPCRRTGCQISMRSEEEERGGGARRRNEEENKEDEETAGGNLCALGPSWSIPQSSVDPTAHPRPPPRRPCWLRPASSPVSPSGRSAQAALRTRPAFATAASPTPAGHRTPPVTDSTTMSDVPETWQGMRHAAQKKGH